MVAAPHRFGAGIVGRVEAAGTRPGRQWEVFTIGAKARHDAVAWCARMAELGAGEILLTSMDATAPATVLTWN